MTGTNRSAPPKSRLWCKEEQISGLTHTKYIEQNRLGTVFRYLWQPGAPVTVSPPSGTEVRSAPGGTGYVGWRRRLGSRRPRPGAGDARINPGLAQARSPDPVAVVGSKQTFSGP